MAMTLLTAARKWSSGVFVAVAIVKNQRVYEEQQKQSIGIHIYSLVSGAMLDTGLCIYKVPCHCPEENSERAATGKSRHLKLEA